MINIISSPASYHSGHDASWFVSDSTVSSGTNFKYVYEVYVSGERVYAGRAVPDNDNGYGIFNASPIVRNFYENYFEPSGYFHVASNDKIKVTYQVRVGEDSNGSITLNMASGEFEAYNYYAPLISDVLGTGLYGAVNINDFMQNLLIDQYGDNWLSDRNLQDIKLELGDYCYVSYFKTTAGDYELHVDTYNEAGVLLNDVSGVANLTGEFNLFNLQAEHINTWAGSTIIDSSVHSYHVYLTRGAYESSHVIVTHECNPKYEQMNLHFLNRVGGWDTMKFGLVNKRSSEYTRSAYKRSEWDFNGTNFVNYDSYNRFNAGSINYAISHRDKFRLTSDWVSEQDITWLSQLVSSPIVYLELNGGYYPVSILGSTHDYKIVAADKLFNFEVEVEIGKQTHSQFR